MKNSNFCCKLSAALFFLFFVSLNLIAVAHEPYVDDPANDQDDEHQGSPAVDQDHGHPDIFCQYKGNDRSCNNEDLKYESETEASYKFPDFVVQGLNCAVEFFFGDIFFGDRSICLFLSGLDGQLEQASLLKLLFKIQFTVRRCPESSFFVVYLSKDPSAAVLAAKIQKRQENICGNDHADQVYERPGVPAVA